METQNPNAAELLCGSVVEEARRKEHDLTMEAQRKAREILSLADQEGGVLVCEAGEAARAQAEKQRASLMAAVGVRVERCRSKHVEGILEGLRVELMGRVAVVGSQPFRRIVLRGVSEALRRMDGDEFVLRASEVTCRGLGSDWEAELLERDGGVGGRLRVEVDAGCAEGEVVLQDLEGRRSWRVDPLARLERAWPELRRQIVAALGWECSLAGGEEGGHR